MYNVEEIRKDFPVLRQMIHGKPLVYFDNAATTQKPQCVLDVILKYYQEDNANIHRGVHTLSERATRKYEEARECIQKFIHAKCKYEIIFTKGTTESINLVAHSYGGSQLQPGDEIIISQMEHHSNIVPWQLLCEQKKCILKVIPINSRGEILLEDYKNSLSSKTKIVSITHISNVLGSVNPIKEMIALAHERGAIFLVDGAQAPAHTRIDVQDLNCDFYAFSSHKMLGPTGVGVLYGKEKYLEIMPPYQGGGSMIRQVSFEKTTYADLPYKFEAGTQAIAGVIGLAEAVRYLTALGLENIENYEKKLLSYIENKILEIPEITVLSQALKKSSILSFVYKGVHAHDIATILDHEGIAIRAGHHCAMPLMSHLGVDASCRASLALYNTQDEVDSFVEGLKKVKEVFKSVIT